MADVMVTCPTVHNSSTTVAQLRRFFDDEHVHAALLVDAAELIGVVERADLMTADVSGDAQARTIASLAQRTIHPTASLANVLESIKRSERRRLAVVDDNGTLLGLLCLKANGQGYCSDADVRNRASGRSRDWLGAVSVGG